MSNEPESVNRESRRGFLKASAGVMGVLAGTPGYVAGSDVIRVGVIGSGGRGSILRIMWTSG